ncbi:hypothetical protein EJB05_46165 [Eragrostis curvula]|uniref:Reverse transcriptase zinc-binding domain-containing protein n=1 Tax=Eragrostis curvula TaxID=38414 RepID=A0A5J9TMG6_9POAL|nr:hypothetical protein EJB05_46165 [Eragrostis curvula]
MAADEQDPHANIIWSTSVPTKLKFFAWLLCNDRLPTRANLLHKNILLPEEACCPRCPGVLETADHLFFGCPAATSFYLLLGLDVTSATCTRPWLRSPNGNTGRWHDILLMLLWRVWNSRNDLVFDRRDLDSAASLRIVLADLDAWGFRYKKTDAIHNMASWRSYLSLRLG